LCQIVEEDVDEKPKLLMSCFGGAQYFSMPDELQKELMNSISQAAVTKGIF
jgi:hypothetical protein